MARQKWHDGKDMKLLFNDDYVDWLEFNKFVDMDNTNDFSKCQRVILFCRYRLDGLGKPMSFENISIKTGISLRYIRDFMRYMKTPQPRICPIEKCEKGGNSESISETDSM